MPPEWVREYCLSLPHTTELKDILQSAYKIVFSGLTKKAQKELGSTS